MSRAKVLFTAIYSFTAPFAAMALAQTPAFEVASIRPSDEGGLPMTVGPGLRNGTLHGERVTLKMLLAAAYGMTEPRVIGPGWLNSNRFDIVAKSPAGVRDSALKPMLQTLLKERFKLAAHLAVQEMPVYFLEVAKSGVKMPLYPAHDRGPDRPGDQYRGGVMMRGTGTVAQIAQRMSSIVDRPVLDRTGLTDRYNYFLVFAPLSPPSGVHEPESAQPDIFAAVQEQLGLKLQAGRNDVEVVVVDHIERMPTEN
jgi:uncharacterized protein (TIGR03435 family)